MIRALSLKATVAKDELGALLIIVGVLATGDVFTTVSINTLISRVSTENRRGENLGFAQSGDGLARAMAR